MITKMSNAESEKLVSTNNAVKSAQRTIMAIGIKSNPILKIIQKLNSRTECVLNAQKNTLTNNSMIPQISFTLEKVLFLIFFINGAWVVI